MWLPEVMPSTPASKSSSAVVRVSPRPPAAFSPLAITRWASVSRRMVGRRVCTVRRPKRPTMSPTKRTFKLPPEPRGWGAALGPLPRHRLLCVLYRSFLADDGDLDLPWVLQRFFNLLADVL